MRYLAGLLIVLALTGCPANPPKERLVIVPTTVGVPSQLTTPCPVEMPVDDSVGELLRVARERRTSLDQCNNKLDAIRNLMK